MDSFVDEMRAKRLCAYEASPGDIREHYGIEQVVLAGGYGYRQVLELIQNGADAILEEYELGSGSHDQAQIEVHLDGSLFYVANTGAPFSERGIEALLQSHSSTKQGKQIGRFGLGFKSMLRLGGKIDITSGHVAFGFDPERCRAELRDRFEVQDVPALRLAWPLAESRAATLRSKFPWATTVVCAEIQTDGILKHLQAEIGGFPPEFLLFLPVPIHLTLSCDADADLNRELHCIRDANDVVLYNGKETSRWRVAEQLALISDQRAKDDATHIHARDSVPLAWAMPIEGKREEAGRFWAFFPTQTPTYLPGIINAPWKLNSDRNAIISGEWNTALMKETAKLIADTLPRLITDADPGQVLDAFPRQVERADEVATPMIEFLWNEIQTRALIPNALGDLCHARELWRHPRDTAELADQWRNLANTNHLNQLVHPSCFVRQRASRLDALKERLVPNQAVNQSLPFLRHRNVVDWFDSIASADIARAIRVLKLTEAYAEDCKQDQWSLIRATLAVIPSHDGRLLTAKQAVFAPEGTHVPDGRTPVAKELCENTEVKQILTDVLKVKPLDDSVWSDVLTGALPHDSRWETPSDERWRAFWECMRSAPERVQYQFAMHNNYRVRVRRRDDKWTMADEVLLPGDLVKADDYSTNQMLLVDPKVHAEDLELLAELGVLQFPEGVVSIENFNRLFDWLYYWRDHYKQGVNGRARSSSLVPYGVTLPAGWHFLPQLIGISSAKLTEKFLHALGSGQIPSTVWFGHISVSNYPRVEVHHPLLWFLLRYGTWNVEGEVVRLAAIVAHVSMSTIAMLKKGPELQFALEKLKDASPTVTPSQDDLRTMWQALIRILATPNALIDDSLQELWSSAARDGVVPQVLLTEQGERLLSQIFVTGSPDLARRARTQGYVAITLDAEALALWVENGAQDLAGLTRPEWTEATGPTTLLVSMFPEVTEVLRPEVQGAASCRPLVDLRLIVADRPSPVICLMWANTLLLDMPQLERLPRIERLQHMLVEAASAGWLRYDTDTALRILSDTNVEKRRNHVAQGISLPERLLRAVGNRVEPLRLALGNVGTSGFLQSVAPLQLAELVLAQLGPTTLTALRETLEKEGLKPPSRWNTSDARVFVASINFPAVFATASESRREPEEFITGPIDLPQLHDFQEEVFQGIRKLIVSSTGRRRAVVSLPTGGGKTRVTVEAAVLLILKEESASRSVLWVAQTDELCEQAVQAFRQVWLNRGAQRTDLRIVRLWGGNPNPATQEAGKPIAVVASIQTLNSRMGSAELAWLQNLGLVVIDECHHAITPSYTNLLRFVDAEALKRGVPPKNEPPIIGLSATPFRTDDEESARLARRFDNRWLPTDQENLHRRLREQRVLAEVRNEAIESGIELTPNENERLSKLAKPWEGIDFENLLEAINQRLAGSQQRNELLVDRIRRAEERSILLFANSVLHAEEMAARLNLQGILSVAISGETPTAARRYFLSRFQCGEIRVLCNHTVLGTGFDAPKIDMVLISRAVFSPVRYMQMVGRGLRGEKNGGKAKCKIVTVLDNLGRFRDQHPYHFCQRFFTDQLAGIPSPSSHVNGGPSE